MGIFIAFIASCVINFGIGQVGGVISDGVGFLLMVLICFDRIGGGMVCTLAHSPSEVGMVTPSEGCVSGWSSGGVGFTGIMPGVFAIVANWCVRGAKFICVGDVGVYEVWVVFFGVDVTFSDLVPILFANLCKTTL